MNLPKHWVLCASLLCLEFALTACSSKQRNTPMTLEGGHHADAGGGSAAPTSKTTMGGAGRAGNSGRRIAGTGGHGAEPGGRGGSGGAAGSEAGGAGGSACTTVEPGVLAWAEPVTKPADIRSAVSGAAVTALSDGSAAVAGLFTGAIRFGAGSANEATLSSLDANDPNPRPDAFVSQYAPDGTFQAVTQIRGGAISAIGIAAFPDRSIIVTGTFGSRATFGPSTTSERTLSASGSQSQNLFLARYSTEGRLIWAVAVTGEGTAAAQGLSVTGLSDGSIAVTGSLNGSVTFGAGEAGETTLASANNYEMDGFIARYKSDGTLLWAQRIGASASDNTSRATGESLAALPDGAIAITGVFRGQPVFAAGKPGETMLSGDGTFVAHYTAGGELSWVRQVDNASAYGVATLSDGTTFVTGTFSVMSKFGVGGPHSITLISAGADDGFVARYASTGALDWVRRFGGSESEFSSGVAVGVDSAVLITGRFRQPAAFDAGDGGTFMLEGQASDDVYVAAYDRDGSLAWAKWAGGPGDESGQSVAAAPDGAVFITGHINPTVSSDTLATFGMGEAHETTLREDGTTFLAKYRSCVREH